MNIWNTTEELLDWMLAEIEAMTTEAKTSLTRAQKGSRVWITLLGNTALVEFAGRADANVDDQRAVLAELRCRAAKLSTAAEDLEARLQKE